MTDVFSRKKRSEIMSRIHSTGTRAELLLKLSLEKAHVPFTYQPSILGRPDFLVGQNTVVFVNGCFWHGCPLHYREPKSHTGYWRKKIQMNEIRQRRNKSDLRKQG